METPSIPVGAVNNTDCSVIVVGAFFVNCRSINLTIIHLIRKKAFKRILAQSFIVQFVDLSKT